MNAPKKKPLTPGELVAAALVTGGALALLEYAAPGAVAQIVKALRQPQPKRTEPAVFLQRVPKEGARS